MGYTLYDQIVGKNHLIFLAAFMRPLVGHEDLLAYLVRRLLREWCQ